MPYSQNINAISYATIQHAKVENCGRASASNSISNLYARLPNYMHFRVSQVKRREEVAAAMLKHLN